MDYAAIFKGLNEKKQAYLVTGGLALNLHGVPRLSFDLDLIVDWGSAGELVGLLAEWGYRSDESIGEICSAAGRERLKKRGRHAVSFTSAVHVAARVDLALTVPAPFAELAERATTVHLFGEAIRLVGLDDLETIKKQMGRKEDLEDLRGMEFLVALREGRDLPGFPEARREQMVKFQQWPAENRIDWLVTSSQLQRQVDESSSGGKGRGGLKRRRIRGLRHTDLS